MIRHKSVTQWPGYRRLGDAVCDPHHTRGGDEKRGFPSLGLKTGGTVSHWFGLKTNATVSHWFRLKTNAMVW
jgi:hypothetical protein